MDTAGMLENFVYGCWNYKSGRNLGTCQLVRGDLIAPYSHAVVCGLGRGTDQYTKQVIVFYKDGFVGVNVSLLRARYRRSYPRFMEVIERNTDYVTHKTVDYNHIKIYRNRVRDKVGLIGNTRVESDDIQQFIERSFL